MGFYLLNNTDIAACYAQRQYYSERVSIIVDWDVHHDNDTQDIFWDDLNILFCSTHQMLLLSGIVVKSEIVIGNNIVNVPPSPDAGSDYFYAALRLRVLSAFNNFAPYFIVSSSVDAHYRDPLAGLNLTKTAFDLVTGQLMDHARDMLRTVSSGYLDSDYDLHGSHPFPFPLT